MAPRRRTKPKPKAKPAPVPVDPRFKKEYHRYNPMREVVTEEDGDSYLPHELSNGNFVEYLILNGMTEEGYWLNVKNGEDQAKDIDKNGMPTPTDRLTNDQKGWAKADHFDHYQKEIARWRPMPGKDSKVKPWQHAARIHDRLYRTACDDGADAKLELWGYRWDLRELWQCQTCGEVIIFITNNNQISNNGDGNESTGE